MLGIPWFLCHISFSLYIVCEKLYGCETGHVEFGAFCCRWTVEGLCMMLLSLYFVCERLCGCETGPAEFEAFSC